MRTLSLSCLTLLLAVGCAKSTDWKVSASDEPKAPASMLSTTPLAPEDQKILGYWVIDGIPEVSAPDHVFRRLRFSSTEKSPGVFAHVLDYCVSEGGSAGWFALEHGSLSTNISLGSFTKKDGTVDFERLDAAEKFKARVTTLTETTLVLNGQFNYRRFKPAFELKGSRQGTESLCEFPIK